MIKVKCVDVYNTNNMLQIGKIYEVLDESRDYYNLDCSGCWLKSRFEVVEGEEQMNHRQKMKELLPIIQAYCDGAEVEFNTGSGTWEMPVDDPMFFPNLEYRIKQTPDSIDWSHVHKDVVSMERHRNGLLRFRLTNGQYFDTIQETFASYKQGTVSWEDSLMERPERV